METGREEFDVGISEVGCSEQRAPDGQSLTVRTTLLLTYTTLFRAIVEVPDPPCVSVSDVGLRDIEKSGTGATPQDANLKDPMKVLQLKLPFDGKYSLVYQ